MTKVNKIIKQVSATPLTFKPLNEANSSNSLGKYIFSGIFTQCSVPGHVIINRNNRSYPEKTVLAHLSYLRESIKRDGCLLGELDHPEGRFDIQLKEASHKITDLWYDQTNHCVMGKLELLDTPNGKIAQELVESNYPLFVSSRAAGDVNEKTHEVEIMQIFTYDIVCTPGFAEARLERVNESAVSPATMKYLNESVGTKKTGKSYKNGMMIIESDSTVIDEKLINEYKKMANNPETIKNLCKPLLEEDDSSEQKDNKSENSTKDDSNNFQLPDMSTNPNDEKNDDKKDDSTKNDKSDDTNTDSDKEAKKDLILSISSEDEDGNIIKDDEETPDSEKQEKRDLILSIESETDNDTDKENDDNDENSEDDEKKDKENEENMNEENKKKDKIEKEVNDALNKYESLLDEVTKTETVKESIIRRYPFAISLSESNFAKFAALRPKQKKKCADFIVEHNIFDIMAINELWSTPLREEKRIQENWLKLASQSDIDLYVKAPLEVQDAIEENAKYAILETKEEVDEFWRRTGLREAEARRRMNEEFVNSYNTNKKRVNEQNSSAEQLGYNFDYIKMTEDWFNNEDY